MVPLILETPIQGSQGYGPMLGAHAFNLRLEVCTELPTLRDAWAVVRVGYCPLPVTVCIRGPIELCAFVRSRLQGLASAQVSSVFCGG